MSQKPKKKNQGGGGPSRPVEPARLVAPKLAPSGGPSAVFLTPADEAEPRVDAAPMPAWFFIVLIVLAYWAMLHLDQYAGGFNDLVFGPYQSYAQLADLQPKSGIEMTMAKGKATFDLICLPCHQSTGLGAPGLAPPLVGSDWVLGSPNRLIRIPLNGLTGPVQVKDQTWALQMPPFGIGQGALLSDDATVAALLTFIRNNWGNKALPITADQVKAIRPEAEAHPGQWTADELLKIPE